MYHCALQKMKNWIRKASITKNVSIIERAGLLSLISVQRIFSPKKREFVHSASSVLTVVSSISIWFDTNRCTFITYSQYIICRMMNTHYNGLVWLFLKILHRLPANGHLLYVIFSRKRIKNITQLCIDWCLIDWFETGLFRVRVQICNIICLILL